MSTALDMIDQFLAVAPKGDGGGGPTWLVVLALIFVGGAFLARYLLRR